MPTKLDEGCQLCSDFKYKAVPSPNITATFTSKDLGCPPLEKYRRDRDHPGGDPRHGHWVAVLAQKRREADLVSSSKTLWALQT